MVDLCEQEDLAFLPWAPIIDLDTHPAISDIAARYDATPRQIALAWLLARSPAMLPIPGTGSVSHLEENVAAAAMQLEPAEVAAITRAA
jgi:aryl-alcohol dehydrogenase-like predicted oxidoreductase